MALHHMGLMALWDRLRSAGAPQLNARLAAETLDLPAATIQREVSLGAVQAAILELYVRAFGGVLRCSEACPECDSPIAADLTAASLIDTQNAAPPLAGDVHIDGWSIRYRAPTQRDLHRASQQPDEAQAAAELLRQIVLGVERSGVSGPSVDDLPEPVRRQLLEQLEREDPLAAAEVALSCPDCNATWTSGIEAGRLFRLQLEAWARRTLYDVHQLAMRYGWREQDILAMHPARREAYLLLETP